MMKLLKKFRSGWKHLMEQLKPMTWAERVDHLWTYYKEWLWIGAVVAILICATVSSIINLSKDVVVTGIMVNLTIDQEGYNYLSSDYAEKIGADSFWEEVRLEYTVFETMTAESATEKNYYAAMTVVAEVGAKKLDYIILDKPGMEFYITQDVYMDLREFFTEEEIEQFVREDRLVYAQEEGSEDKWVAAVDITKTAFVQDTITSEGPIYFALAGNTEKPEMCRDVWNHIHAWESPET